jgi:hypothetical protein
MTDEQPKGDDSVTDLLIHNYEICVRTSVSMMKMPLVMYSDAIDRWAKAVDFMVEDVQSRR